MAVSKWSLTMEFIIKSNSTNTISWFNDPSKTRWNFQNLIRESLSQFAVHNRWSTVHVKRSGNEVADLLAKADAHGSINFVCVLGFCRLFWYILINEQFKKSTRPKIYKNKKKTHPNWVAWARPTSHLAHEIVLPQPFSLQTLLSPLPKVSLHHLHLNYIHLFNFFLTKSPKATTITMEMDKIQLTP